MQYNRHTYQTRLKDFILAHRYAFLTVDMGLGKTVTTLTAIAELLDCVEVARVLVIAPKSVAENTWTSECAKWDHLAHLRVSVVMGDEKRRLKALADEADIYVINRDNVAWLTRQQGARWSFDTVIIDESSSFKNPQAQRFKALRRVRPFIRRLVLLTGTPSPNGHMDLWSQMWLIDMGERLGRTLGAYRTRYFRPGRSNGHVVYNWNLLPGAADAISEKMADVTVSLKAEDWLEVPDLIESDVRIRLSCDEMERYRNFERDQIMTIAGEDIVAITAAALANKLLQFTGGAMYDQDHEFHRVSDAKLRALDDILEAADGDPVLVFYQYRHELERLQERYAGMRPVTFSGEPEILKEWNEGRIPLLLCQPASVQYGLNMQQGGHIIVWYTPTWNLEQYQQANARLHRQGQERPVICYRLVCSGTIDDKVVGALRGKDGAQEALLRMIRAICAENDNKEMAH
jgi:SNF2 family DNA or RNA helicase